MVDFTVKLAESRIGISALHHTSRAWCEDYLDEGPVDYQINVTQEGIDALRSHRFFVRAQDWFIEMALLEAEIGNWLPMRDTFVVHGAAIEFQGKAYLFCAYSGVGKTTHISLWKNCLGKDVRVINGDKPPIRIAEDGGVFAYGAPWCGKERWNTNASAPVAGICFIGNGQENRIRRLEPAEALDLMMPQVFITEPAESLARVLELTDALLARVPLYELSCDVSEDAVRTSFEGMTGLRYADYTCR